jgi:TPP-dependent pyruvate/acetoin dehydrogenase alpha subunit
MLWSLFRQMLRSRFFEEVVKLLWDEGQISGEMHMSIGEEGIVAGVVTQLKDGMPWPSIIGEQRR